MMILFLLGKKSLTLNPSPRERDLSGASAATSLSFEEGRGEAHNCFCFTQSKLHLKPYFCTSKI